MRIKRPMIIHPLLFAIYPILYLYANNVDLLSFSETLMPLAVTLGLTIMLFLGLKLLFKDGTRAGILTSAVLILFFSYGHIRKALELVDLAIWNQALDWHWYLLLLWGWLFLFAVWVVVKMGSHLRTITTYLNVVSALLMAVPVLTVGMYTVSHARLGLPPPTPENQTWFEATERQPNIYYIILDAYGRADILREVYGYDNSAFIEHLTSKGFYVASRSRCNYPQSYLSLASSLNMEYLNYLSDELGVDSRDRTIPDSMIVDNRVWRALRGAGYRFLHLSSGYGPTDHNRFADINYRPEVLNDFRTMLLETTILNPIVSPLGAAQKRARTLFTFEMIGEIARVEEPTFVFAHLLVPHPPFVFDRNCDPGPHTQGIWLGRPYEPKGYVDQLFCVNKMVVALVDEILAESKVPPIIILQADHGPESTTVEWDPPTEAFLRERMGIFNAYHLPGDGRSQLYASITPVNTFRLIFDFYFGTNLGLLEDKGYFSDYWHPYEFIQVVE